MDFNIRDCKRILPRATPSSSFTLEKHHHISVSSACTGHRLEQCPILQALPVCVSSGGRARPPLQAQTEPSSTTRFSIVDPMPWMKNRSLLGFT